MVVLRITMDGVLVHEREIRRRLDLLEALDAFPPVKPAGGTVIMMGDGRLRTTLVAVSGGPAFAPSWRDPSDVKQ